MLVVDIIVILLVVPGLLGVVLQSVIFILMLSNQGSTNFAYAAIGTRSNEVFRVDGVPSDIW
ncbi:hypothetical protein [Burkholderia cepacia]|uniref:hypothetical protein n=1 Tax=Burkholderia cepacia TaxID=292 RepID=UPI002AB6A3F4|nr:hypothetical protein [Burkholderia cepacia]